MFPHYLKKVIENDVTNKRCVLFHIVLLRTQLRVYLIRSLTIKVIVALRIAQVM